MHHSHLGVAVAPQRPIPSASSLSGPTPAIPTLRQLQTHHIKSKNNNNNKVTVNNNYKVAPGQDSSPTAVSMHSPARTVPPVVLKLTAGKASSSADQPLKRTYSVTSSSTEDRNESGHSKKKKRDISESDGEKRDSLKNGMRVDSISTSASTEGHPVASTMSSPLIPPTSAPASVPSAVSKRDALLAASKMVPQSFQGALAQHILLQHHLGRNTHPAVPSVGKAEMIANYQPWVIMTYGDAAKTKTITLTKYARIIRTLRGEEPNSAENSKFRFWVRAKGFRMGQPEGYAPKPADAVAGSYTIDTSTGRVFVRNSEDPSQGHQADTPPLYVPTANVKDEEGRDQALYKKVAVVENFFDIIYSVHVDIEGRGAKHAGQKRTYRTITDSYAFLPREAVTRFLLGCTECQRRPRSPASPMTKSSPSVSPCPSPTSNVVNGGASTTNGAIGNAKKCPTPQTTAPTPSGHRSAFMPPQPSSAFGSPSMPKLMQPSGADYTSPLLNPTIASNPLLNSRLHHPYPSSMNDIDPGGLYASALANSRFSPTGHSSIVKVNQPEPKSQVTSEVPHSESSDRKSFPLKLPESTPLPYTQKSSDAGVFVVPTSPSLNSSAFSVQNLSTSSRKPSVTSSDTFSPSDVSYRATNGDYIRHRNQTDKTEDAIITTYSSLHSNSAQEEDDVICLNPIDSKDASKNAFASPKVKSTQDSRTDTFNIRSISKPKNEGSVSDEFAKPPIPKPRNASHDSSSNVFAVPSIPKPRPSLHDAVRSEPNTYSVHPSRHYSLLSTMKPSRSKNGDDDASPTQDLDKPTFTCPLRPLEQIAPNPAAFPGQDFPADLSWSNLPSFAGPGPSSHPTAGEKPRDSQGEEMAQDLSSSSTTSSLMGGLQATEGGSLLNLLIKSGVLRNGGPRTVIPDAQGIDFSLPITTTYLKHMRSLGYSDEDALKIDVEVSLYQHVLGVPLKTVDDYL